MKKVKEFFMRWFSWFFCITEKNKCNTDKKETNVYLEPVITDECPKENKETNELVTKETINPVGENSRKRSKKKGNTSSTDNREEQKESKEKKSENILQSVESTETSGKKTKRNRTKKVVKDIPEGGDYRVEVAEKRKRLKKKNETK